MPMTERELILAAMAASDRGTPKVAVFQPALTKARVVRVRGLRAVTRLTFEVYQREFTVTDALALQAYLVVGTVDALQVLIDAHPGEATP